MPENAIDFDGRINVIGSPDFIAKAIVKLLKNPLARTKEFFERE